MTDRRFYVYVIFDLDGIPRYVGKGNGRRWLAHFGTKRKHPNRRLAALIKRAGDADLPRLKIREGLTNAEACEVEVNLIAAIGRGKHGPLLNMTDGGEGFAGYKRSPELAKKAGIASGNARRGNKYGPMPQEHRTAISRAKKGKPRRGVKGAGKGKPKTDAHRQAISVALIEYCQRRKSDPIARAAHIKSVQSGWEKRRRGNKRKNQYA